MPYITNQIFFDIDTESDFQFAKSMIKKYFIPFSITLFNLKGTVGLK